MADDDMPGLEPAQTSVPFPSLMAAPGIASGPQAWQQQQSNLTGLGASTASPRVSTAAHVAVPPSLASFGGVHFHDGVACGHSHGSAPPPSSSPQPTSTTSYTQAYPQPSSSPHQHASSSSSSSSSNDHGHSHGGAPCSGHGHGDDTNHGHSHSSTSDSASSAAAAARSRAPIVYDDPSKQPRGSYLRRLINWFRLAWRGGGDSRHVLIYVFLKLCFMSVQFGWGLYQDNLGLVSSSFHTGFDVIALGCSLLAMLNAKYPAKHPYSYGFDRQEIVAAFTNAIFLFFVATFMIIETFHTAYFPPEVESDDIILAGLGFAMDLLGLALFHQHLVLKSQSDIPEAATNWTISSLASAGRGHHENMHGVSLHVVSDIVGHSSLLLAVWINQLYPNFSFIFALSFLLSAILIIQLVVPLFQTTGAILLMTTPHSIRLGLDRSIREISFYDGVLELRSAHWWTQAPGVIVGSLHIRIRADAQEQVILGYVHSVLKKYVAILTVQVEKDQIPVNWMIQNTRSP